MGLGSKTANAGNVFNDARGLSAEENHGLGNAKIEAAHNLHINHQFGVWRLQFFVKL